MTIERTFTARHEYKCDGYDDPDAYTTCQEPIRPGDRYVRVSLPPWEDYEGDVDDDGRSIAILRPEGERRWQVLRRHGRCWIG